MPKRPCRLRLLGAMVGLSAAVRACACSPGLSRHGAKRWSKPLVQDSESRLAQYCQDYHSPRAGPLICCGGPGLLAWGYNVCLAGRCVEELLQRTCTRSADAGPGSAAPDTICG